MLQTWSGTLFPSPGWLYSTHILLSLCIHRLLVIEFKSISHPVFHVKCVSPPTSSHIFKVTFRSLVTLNVLLPCKWFLHCVAQAIITRKKKVFIHAQFRSNHSPWVFLIHTNLNLRIWELWVLSMTRQADTSHFYLVYSFCLEEGSTKIFCLTWISSGSTYRLAKLKHS